MNIWICSSKPDCTHVHCRQKVQWEMLGWLLCAANTQLLAAVRLGEKGEFL